MSDTAGLAPNVRLRLSVMMLLQYAFNGVWIIPLGTFLSKTAKFSDAQIGLAYGMVAIGSIIAPFFIGLIADRYVAGQKLLGVLNILASVVLLAMSWMAFTVVDGQVVPQPVLFNTMMLLHCICYMPSFPLTNHIAMSHMSNPGKQFPAIRMMGTIGFILVGVVGNRELREWLGFNLDLEATNIPMQLGAAIGLVTAAFSFFLPHTPPAGAASKASLAEMLGAKALGLFRDRNFAVFAATAFLIMLPAMFYWAFCNLFLNEIAMPSAMFKQTYGQMAEMVFLLIMPLLFAVFGVKWMLVIGMVSWIARFACFAFGQMGAPNEWMLYAGLILHGACFDFFFVTGFLYTDRKASRDIRASAQGLISLIIYGLGWFAGSNLAAQVLKLHSLTDSAGKVIGHNWRLIWLYPIAMVVALMAAFLIFFNDNARVGHAEPEPATEKVPGKAPVGV